MFYVYVYFSVKDGRFYIGYTNDLRRRTREHKNKKVKSTAKRKDLKLIFYEAYLAKKDAQRRERYFKTSKGKKLLKQMLADSISTLNN